jgi:hypothetical protein
MPSPTLGPQMRVRRVTDLLETEIEDEKVMMDIDQGRYYGLNGTGTRIWPLLAEPVLIRDLCDRLAAEFDVPAEQCERDVVGFLSDLLDRGLLQVVTDEAS